MKYVVSWQPKSTESEEVQARSLQVFSKWSPPEGTTFLQFLGRIDGTGGFAVVETDDPALLASANAVFSAFFDMNVSRFWISRKRHGSAARQSSSANRCDQAAHPCRRQWSSLQTAQAFVRFRGRAPSQEL
jgi:hypothetical protein